MKSSITLFLFIFCTCFAACISLGFITQQNFQAILNAVPGHNSWLAVAVVTIACVFGYVAYYVFIEHRKNSHAIIALNKLLEERNAEISSLNDLLEKRVAERTLELKQANKELETFNYTVSHDLHAPLRIINAYAQVLLKTERYNLRKESAEILENMLNKTNQMGDSIASLLNFSRLGKNALVKQTVNMNEGVDAAVQEVKQSLNGSFNAAITVHDMAPTVCDSNLIKHVWSNLISNAVKYSRRKINPEVEIGSDNKNGKVVYYVKDNGAGFDMKQADNLFRVFKRLHKSSEYEGTGVGLALAHKIITRHGGSIWAEAKVNEGATFYFTLS